MTEETVNSYLLLFDRNLALRPHVLSMLLSFAILGFAQTHVCVFLTKYKSAVPTLLTPLNLSRHQVATNKSALHGSVTKYRLQHQHQFFNQWMQLIVQDCFILPCNQGTLNVFFSTTDWKRNCTRYPIRIPTDLDSTTIRLLSENTYLLRYI